MDLKAKLRQIEDDLGQLRTDRAELARKRDDAKAAFAAIPGYDAESAEFKAAEEAIRAVGAKDDQIAQTQQAQVGVLRMLGAGDPAAGALKAADDPTQPSAGWDSGLIVKGESYRRLAESGAFHSSARVGNHSLGQVASREGFKAEVTRATVTANLDSPDYRGLLPPLLAPLTILDLVPVGTTDSNSIEYTQATTLPAQAAETAEGAVKPEATIAFTDATAVIRTIAVWIKARKQVLADVPMLQSFIDTSLRYDVRSRLARQVLNGNGTGENLRGILQTTGIGTVAAGTESVADAVMHAIVAIQLAQLQPNAIVLHPSDWEGVRLSRDDSGAGAGTGGYLFGSPAAQFNPTLWGIPVVVDASMTAGTGLVADFRQALLAMRSGVEVLVSDSDQDDFIRNRVTILSECRAGLLVPRPQGFVTVTGI